MLYAFYGSDHAISAKKARSLIASLQAKRPDAAFEQMNGDTWNASVLQGHLGGQGLFSEKYIIFLDRVTENEIALEEIVSFMESLKESANIFIMLESKITAPLQKTIEKYAEKVVVSDSKIANEKPSGNAFALGDALGSKNAFRAWSLYREAIDNGIEVENIAGTLFWQVKSMMVANVSNSSQESGLNPFVFSKSKKFASNYSKENIDRMLNDLVRIYHEGHRGLCNMELELEKMILTRLV